MAAESCWIWATSGRSTATSARTISPLASASSSPVCERGAERNRARSSGRGRVVRQRRKGTEAMAVSAEQIAEDEGIPRITLASCSGVPGAARLEGVGVDGDDRVAGVQEGIDDEARGTFEGDGDGGGRAEARQLAQQLRQAFGRVRHAALPAHLTRGVEDAHGV